MRGRIVLAIALAVLAGCKWQRTTPMRGAVGSEGALVTAPPCRVEEGASVVSLKTFADGEQVYTISESGRARIRCDYETFQVDAREAAALAVRLPPVMVVGDRVKAAAVAFDAEGQELELGVYSSLDWEIALPLVSANTRCEFPPWCDSPGPAKTWVQAQGPGVGGAQVSFRKLSASARVQIEPQRSSTSPDGGAAALLP